MPFSGLHVSLFLYVLIVVALLIAELREDRRAQFFFKPMAAFGFVILALQVGALETTYGKYILAGLMACAVGDVFLLSRKSQGLFIAGMAAFALGHLAYLAAFAGHSEEDASWLFLIPLIFAFMIILFVYRGIIPKLNRPMKFAIALYTAIIFLMVFFAMDIDAMEMRFLAPIAAAMFAVSDMFVARDRFVKPGPKNFLAITPLYFGAQALFALSVSI